MGAIVESLALSPTYLRNKLEQGVDVIIANKYPQSSPSSNMLGLSSHTDHSFITILLENMSGLEIMDFTDDNAWKSVPATDGALKVLVGNHLEVLSNELYNSNSYSILNGRHERVPSPLMSRASVGSFLSLAMEDMVEPATELVDEDHPERYSASSLDEYMKFLSFKEEKSYIESLKI
ncbi:hypothetical protein PRUPE_5G059400 [Prunus persica]|uniref:Isopenicillin N synthase-like Fe(2+) 2OG dioxygenase domain-containing protein n=1 Tax=Prunus persica TaxID=3760 RepID=A0A251P4E7_PRUPE|nr:hypothetical protein PRUPE_5G059400 [Prunus persica]